jgi:hypothetical protein
MKNKKVWSKRSKERWSSEVGSRGIGSSVVSLQADFSKLPLTPLLPHRAATTSNPAHQDSLASTSDTWPAFLHQKWTSLLEKNITTFTHNKMYSDD